MRKRDCYFHEHKLRFSLSVYIFFGFLYQQTLKGHVRFYSYYHNTIYVFLKKLAETLKDCIVVSLSSFRSIRGQTPVNIWSSVVYLQSDETSDITINFFKIATISFLCSTPLIRFLPTMLDDIYILIMFQR